MSYNSNPQIYNSNEASNASDNAPRPIAIANGARALVRDLGPEVNFGLQQILNRCHGADAEGQIKVVSEAMSWAKDRVAEAKAEVDRLNAVTLAHHAAAAAWTRSVQVRGDWANAHARPFWQAGADIARMAAEIAATRPTSSTLGMANATAPLGDDVDLLAALDVAEAGLTRISAALKAIRADVTARVKGVK